jgi:ABC-2 type transport system permease protein
MTIKALDLRENNLQQIALILEKGARGAGITALGVAILGIITGFTGGYLFPLFANVLLGGYSGNADTALVSVIFLALLNMALFLILMVGVMAQEFWSVIGVGLVLALNIGLLFAFRYLPAIGFIGVAGYALYLMMSDIRAYRVNPLMVKELRERMRGMRAFVVITVYLALMGGFITLMYLISTQNVNTLTVTGVLGRNLFRGVVMMQMLLIVFIAPSFTANTVTSEYEQRTYDLLQITLLPYQSFIIGKLESALSYIFLLLIAAIPIQSIAFLFGGVSQLELVITFAILTMSAILLGTVGLYFSILLQQTIVASIRTYLIAFGFMVVLPNVVITLIQIIRMTLDDIVDKYAQIQALLIYLQNIAESISPINALTKSQELILNERGIIFYTESIFDGRALTHVPLIAHWLMLCIIYAILSAIFLILSVRKLKSNDDALTS